MASIRVTRALTRSSHILCSNKDPQLKKLANSKTRFLLGFSEGGYTRDNVHFVGCQICQLLNTLGYTKVSQLLELLEPAPRHDV
jgi:energy-converting hydrogenase Eha subunit B